MRIYNLTEKGKVHLLNTHSRPKTFRRVVLSMVADSRRRGITSESIVIRLSQVRGKPDTNRIKVNRSLVEMSRVGFIK